MVLRGAHRVLAGPEIASWLGTKVGEPVIYLPRRAYDLWNTRYFIVPAFANGWRDEARASAAFRFESELVYPEAGRFDGPHGKEDSKHWIDSQDYEVLRNAQEFPRSWVVHIARPIQSFEESSRDLRAAAMKEILYAGDLFWNEQGLTPFDPRGVAWVDSADIARIAPKLSGLPPEKSETVKVRYPDPQRVILEVTLQSSGLVILSDVHYPGWQLKIDDDPAPIYRVNVSMRGALVAAGPHRLEYSFAPRSFQIGFIGSFAGICAWLALGLYCTVRPVHPVLAMGREIKRTRRISGSMG